MFLITKYLTMLLPELHGKCTQKEFFIYTACDTDYFVEFGRSLITSIQRNSQVGVHIHLYNPTACQTAWCDAQPNLSMTWESAELDLFAAAADAWRTEPRDPIPLDQYRRTLNAMSKSNDQSIQQRMQRTYYACARFVRLNQIVI